MSRSFDVMAAGHLCLDIIPKIPDTGARQLGDLMQPGKLVEVNEATLCTGGPVSNTGIAMKRLGCNVCFNARVGDDAFGTITLDLLRENGNAEGVNVVHDAASSYTIAIAPPGIDRIFLHNPATNDEYSANDLNPTFISQCRLFHFGYPPLMRRMYEGKGDELLKVFKTAKAAGTTTSCDMALPDPASASGKAPWRKILEQVLPYVDVFLPSIEEALYMLEPDTFMRYKDTHKDELLIDVLTAEDYTRLADQFLAMGTKIVSLKSAHRGFYIKTGKQAAIEAMGEAKPGDAEAWANREIWGPAFHAPHVASATGSGDSSIGGFLTAFLNGLDPEGCVRCANCVGWQNVQVVDAVSGIKSWEETMEMLKQNMPINELAITAPGWSWDATKRLWERR